jgi:hypothetical protein
MQVNWLERRRKNTLLKVATFVKKNLMGQWIAKFLYWVGTAMDTARMRGETTSMDDTDMHQGPTQAAKYT